MRNAKFYPWLLPYIEDDLDAARRARLEALLAADPDLAAEAERLRRTCARLQAARTPPANAVPSADAWPRLRARLVPAPAPPSRPARGWWLAGAGATAAAGLVLGAVLLPGWHAPDLSHPTPPPPTVAPRETQTVPAPAASGGLGTKPPPVSAHRMIASAKSAPPPMAPGAPPVPAAPLVPGMSVPKPPPSVSADPFALPPGGRFSGPGDGRVSVSPPAAPPLTNGAPEKPAPPPPSHSAMPMAVSPAPASMTAPAPVTTAPAPSPARATGTQDAPAPGRDASGVSTLDGQQQAKAQPLYQRPAPAFGQPKAFRRGVMAKHSAAGFAPPAAVVGGAMAAGETRNGLAVDALDVWQASLTAAVSPPLWGEDAGAQQANRALLAAKEAGQLDGLRAQLEARRARSPHDVAVGRMLAAVADFGFTKEEALRERRRIVGLEGSNGEDWFALARSEERAGSNAAARAAYKRALESPVPPTPFHAAIARQRR